MLAAPAFLLVVATTLAVTASVTALTLVVLRAARRAGIAARLAIVLAGAVLSITASALAVAAEMYLSAHDLNVLGWVIGVSAVMSVAAAWLVARSVVRSSTAAVVSSTRRVGRGDIVDAPATGLREFDAVAAELASTSQRLADARAQVAELDEARKQFFAWISHDLRTPLAGMRAMAEALEEGTAPDPRAYARLIRGKVDSVTQLVDDLFELSKLQTGTLELHPEAVVLLDLVSDAVSDVQTVAAGRGIQIAQDRIGSHIIWADPRELTRAIGNLLTNGVRHAPDNSTILIRADTLSDGQLILSVIDQGPGVAAENLGRMFDVGWRADSSRTADTPGASAGAGLGLAIVRGIVEAHGGRVQARQSEAGFQLDLILPPVAA
ncbi:sensor histidine kinase [Rathayibacter soli]|uniref:sensor histidine kinase n=1 Tax=Rathayibacter soli TaxID=3144168 RepID=UPI0027E52CEA|nr:HAMP domain-containing sensor histidine kinase [Glaciibacter superstes]